MSFEVSPFQKILDLLLQPAAERKLATALTRDD